MKADYINKKLQDYFHGIVGQIIRLVEGGCVCLVIADNFDDCALYAADIDLAEATIVDQ